MSDKKLNEYIKEIHAIHPLIGCDIGAIRHSRIVSVLKKFPNLDYMYISHEMDKLDELDKTKERNIYENWAKRCL